MKRPWLTLPIAVFTVAVLASCAPLPEGSPAPGASDDAQSHADSSWSYSGKNGPSAWPNKYPQCAARGGSEQSPIDIRTAPAEPTDEVLRFGYGLTTFQFEDDGHSVVGTPLDVAESMLVTEGEDSYRLKQFHLHAPSEHTVDGERADAEVHLVHEDANGSLLVVGVLLREGKANEKLAPIFAAFSKATHSVTRADIDAGVLIPEGASLVHYDGSLTTPPCSEGVKWYVYTTPMEVSEDQLREFIESHPGSARPTQPLNGRDVELLTSVG